LSSVEDKRRIGTGFHRHADEYDQHTIVQKRVVKNLEQLVANHISSQPCRVLDIGCGTGALTAAMQHSFPQADICGLDLAYNMAHRTATRIGPRALIANGDAEQLPFRGGVFDLVVSASTFQWVKQLDRCFTDCCRVLADGGLFCVAFFGGRTLWELHESFDEAFTRRCAGSESRVGRLHRFRDSQEVRRAFDNLGFEQVVVVTETEVEYHPDVPDLLRAIKGIGANTTAGGKGGGLGWRGVLTDMADIYRSRYKAEGLIPATYEVVYVVARKAASNS